MADARLHKFRELLRANVIVFDFDGVLVDSERYHFETYSAVFKKYGHTIDETEYYKYWTSLGLGPKGEVDRYHLAIDPRRIRDEKRPIFSEYCRNGTIRFFPEAHDLVIRLAAAGKTLTIASGTVRGDIEAVLENEGLSDAFAAIAGSDMVAAPKPAPDIFLHALDMVNAKPSDALVFEDAEKGVGSAIAANIPVIVVRTRETTGIDFPGADLVLDSHTELANLARRVFTTG
ncbi:MAG TPA: HAD family phosphatase [Candidatus Krumholzibacteria bacterium]|nr:HAD family phosphatase [Candidatus Krumholzibacteria bacterium]